MKFTLTILAFCKLINLVTSAPTIESTKQQHTLSVSDDADVSTQDKNHDLTSLDVSIPGIEEMHLEEDATLLEGNRWIYLSQRDRFKEVLIALLEKDADVNAHDYNGWTALHHAAFNGNVDMIVTLLAKGAEVMAKDNKGRTALHQAAISGNKRIMMALVEKGADVNAQDNNGNTALHFAAASGFIIDQYGGYMY